MKNIKALSRDQKIRNTPNINQRIVDVEAQIKKLQSELIDLLNEQKGIQGLSPISRALRDKRYSPHRPPVN